MFCSVCFELRGIHFSFLKHTCSLARRGYHPGAPGLQGPGTTVLPPVGTPLNRWHFQTCSQGLFLTLHAFITGFALQTFVQSKKHRIKNSDSDESFTHLHFVYPLVFVCEKIPILARCRSADTTHSF